MKKNILVTGLMTMTLISLAPMQAVAADRERGMRGPGQQMRGATPPARGVFSRPNAERPSSPRNIGSSNIGGRNIAPPRPERQSQPRLQQSRPGNNSGVRWTGRPQTPPQSNSTPRNQSAVNWGTRPPSSRPDADRPRNQGRNQGQANWQQRNDRRPGGPNQNWAYGNRNPNDNQHYRPAQPRPNWNQNWRRDNRYDWQRHRDRYGTRYHYRYNPPRGWGYGYQRFSIGFTLWNGLFASSYWINDPYYYRLPPAYGSLRWVRYYGDAMLVDVRSGYVVDVIYNFFW